MDDKEITILNKIAIPTTEWDTLYSTNPELATAIYYLLIVEETGGIGKAFESRSTSEVNKLVAKEMGWSVPTLLAKRRQWAKDQILAEARAWLQPLRLESLQMMADRVEDHFIAIMNKFLDVATDDKSDVYAKVAAWKVLKSDVLLPAQSNQKATDEGDTDYIKNAEQVEYKLEEDDEAQNYINNSLGSGE